MSYLLVALGSALGGVARHWMTAVVSARLPSAFPWGTVLVNTSGCFLIGVAVALFAPAGRWSSGQARDLVMVGLLGGYTTFSAFSLQTLQLLQQQEYALAMLNVGGSVLSCLLAVAIGYWLVSTHYS